MHNKHRIILLLLIATMSLSFISLFIGYTEGINLQTLSYAITNFDTNDKAQLVLVTQRIPRAINAIIVGASLAISGALAQSMMKNPLASPSTLGINASAIFAVMISMIVFPSLNSRFIFAFIGSCIGLFLTLKVTSLLDRNFSITIMVISGMCINLLFSSLVSLVINLNTQLGDELAIWKIGSLEGKYLTILNNYWWLFLLIIVIIIFSLPKLQVLVIDDQKATSLGINVNQVRIQISLLIAALTALAISIGGPISMIGLVSPHLARKLSNGRIGLTILYSALIGIGILQICDISSRIIISPNELPVGIPAEILASIFFIGLARRSAHE